MGRGMSRGYAPAPAPECATCEATRILTGQGVTEVVAIAVKLRRPPEVIVRHLEDHDRADLRGLLTDQGGPLPEPAVDYRSLAVHCGDCGQLLADGIGSIGRGRQIAALKTRHTCPKKPTTHNQKEATVATPPTSRPPAVELLTHPDKRIARQAAKVQAEQAKLTDLWTADLGKAELRAKRDRLLKQLAQVDAELKGGASAPLPAKRIRQWAAANGIPCPTTGKLPVAVVDAWRSSERAS